MRNEIWVAPDRVIPVEILVERYLTAGVRLVWVIWPRRKQVDVWHPGDTTPAALTVDDTLDGE